jgi:chorismate mutase/prephenate dehydratase
MTELETFRAEIDAIDDELIALFKKRIGVVAKVGEHKRAQGERGAFIRPGREGDMHRRIYDAFKDSGFSAQAAVGIWRLIISASTHHESPLKLAIMQQEGIADVTPLAQSYFGAFLEARNYSNAGTLLSDVYEGKASIGIVPNPQDETALWWQALAQHQEPKLFIFAKLPVVMAHARQPTALAVAEVTPEPSAADESYFAIRLEDTMSTSKLHSSFAEVGISATMLNIASQSPMRWALVMLDGFYTADDAKMAQLSNDLPECQFRFLGAHPKVISA